ncbi:MAG: hypothetical protein JWO77_3535 [Ilumatobacteraceae bacterium]|nr:hypothetical protein [Ilumatobacteraceae bacterium]
MRVCEVCGTVMAPTGNCAVCGSAGGPVGEAERAPVTSHPLAPHAPPAPAPATQDLMSPAIADAPQAAARAPGRRRLKPATLAVAAVVAAVVGISVGLVAGSLSSSDGDQDSSAPTSRSSEDDSTATAGSPTKPTTKTTSKTKSGSAIAQAGEVDGYLVLDDDGVHVQGADGKRSTIVDHPVAAAFDDGRGGLVFQDLRSTDHGLSASMWDLATQQPATEEEGTIWYLPAGVAEPQPLITSPDLDQDWVGLVAAGRLGDRPVAVYARGAFDPELGEAEQFEASFVIRDIEGGRDLLTIPQAWGYEWGIDDVSVREDRISYLSSGEGMSTWNFLDDQLRPITAACTVTYEYDEIDCGSGSVDDRGRIASVEYSETQESLTDLRIVDSGTASEVARYPVVGSPYLGEGGYSVDIDARGDQAIVSFRQLASGPAQPALLFDLTAPAGSEPTPLGATGRVLLLSAPLIRP